MNGIGLMQFIGNFLAFIKLQFQIIKSKPLSNKFISLIDYSDYFGTTQTLINNPQSRILSIMAMRPSHSRINKQPVLLTVNHDVNYLLTCFNQLDRKNSGSITSQTAKIFFRSIDVLNYDQYLQSSTQKLQFDDLLHILGLIQCPSEPSIYVVMFVKLLTDFRNKCLHDDDSSALVEAAQIDKKMKTIIENQIDRQTNRLEFQNKRAFNQMELNQNQQYRVFENEWSSYIGDYGSQVKKKIGQTIDMRNRSIDHEQNRFIKTARRYSVLTSTKLLELEQKKKRLVKEGKYNEALAIKQKIGEEKERIIEQQEAQTSLIATRRFESLNKKKDSIIATTIMTANNNVQKLLRKKQEGEHIMKIRMRSIREEAMKRLSETVKKEVSRLRSLFYEASKG